MLEPITILSKKIWVLFATVTHRKFMLSARAVMEKHAPSTTFPSMLVSSKPFGVSGKQCGIPRFEMPVNLRVTTRCRLYKLKIFPHLASAIMDEELCGCHIESVKPPLCNYDIEANCSRRLAIAGGTGAK